MGEEADFDGFVHASAPRLLRTAAMLMGGRDHAEDLVQAALERTWLHWRAADASPYAYTRRVMVNLATDWWRGRRFKESPLGDWDEPDPGPDPAQAQADRDLALRVLRELTAKERAVIVLRYVEDLSEGQIAEILGVAPGTVKSTASRALKRLRGSTHVRSEASSAEYP
jgi:RNA polymerase sigma-70 factor (sigma-E family)